MSEKQLESIRNLAEKIVSKCTKHGFKVTAAESCTGGMIIAAITSISGSSAATELGICSYSNRIKEDILGVSPKTLEKYTEYSTQCAAEMAKGVLKISGADFSVSTSGVAGPTGGSEENPVGTVYIAVSGKGAVKTVKMNFDGDRDQVRIAATEKALCMLLEEIEETE